MDISEQVQDSVAKAKEQVLEDLDFMNLAPRKPDWDLKRDIAKKLGNNFCYNPNIFF